MPWFLYALIGTLLIAGLIALMPKPKVENARAANLGDFQFPRSEEGDPWPLVYGKVKIKGPNTNYYGALRAVPIITKGPRKYGIVGPRQKIITGYKYHVTMDMGLCIGPDVVLRRIWAGTDVCWEGNISAEAGVAYIDKPNLYGDDNAGGGVQGTVRFYPGNNRQPVNALLASLTDGADTTRQPMKCHAVFEDFYVGTSTSIKPFFFELERYPNTLGIPDGKHRIGDDTNMIEILYDLVTNKFARRGTPVGKINVTNWRAAAVRLADEGNAGSLKVEASNPGRDVVNEILRQIDGIMYTDPGTGMIELVLIRNDYDRNTLPHYDESDIIVVRNYSKPSWEQTVNQMRVKFNDRNADYTSRTVMDQVLANINEQQQVRSTEMEFPACYSGPLAQALCGRELALVSVPFTKAELEFTRKGISLMPGTVFRYSFAEYEIFNEVVRVQGFNLGSLEEGSLTAIVVQDRYVYGDSSAIVPPSGAWTPPTFPPANSGTLVAVRAPLWFNLQMGDPRTEYAFILFFAESPGGLTTFSYRLSVGGALIEEHRPFSVVGTIGAAMPNTMTTIASLAFSSLPSGLVNKTAAEIRQGMNLAMIGSEFIAFETVSGSNLLNVYRGIFGTPVANHAIGTKVYFLGDAGDIDGLLEDPYLPGVTYTFQVETQSIFGLINSTPQTLIYNPPAITNKPRDPFSLLINGSSTPGVDVTNGSSMSLNFSSSDRLDKVILLPGDTLPEAPFGTTYRARIIKASDSSVFYDAPRTAPGAWSITAPTALGAYTFEMRASLNGIESNLATLVFDIV